MIAPPAGVKIWLVAGATDMRRGFTLIELLIVIAIIYWVDTAHALPSFFPGHESAPTSHHHIKHGILFFAIAVVAALFIHEPKAFQTETLLPNRDMVHGARHLLAVGGRVEERANHSIWRDASLWAFVAAMILFHSAAAPGGVYLGLFLNDLGASDGLALIPH